MSKIILTGYMGSGKTQTARLLALKTGLLCKDLDEIIEEKVGMSVAGIFSQKGEIEFRKIEHEVFKCLMESPEDFILSLGGGTPCYAGNHKFLNGSGIISFYLKASIDLLYERLVSQKNHRPLIANISSKALKKFIGKHLFERNYFYNRASHIIRIDSKSPERIVIEIERLLV